MSGLLLGILASSLPSGGDYESIATVTATGSSSSVTFTNIPSTFQHLQIRAIAREGSGTLSGPNGVDIRFNSDTGSNYASHRLYGDGSGAAADGSANATFATTGQWAIGTQVASGTVGAAVIDILDYASTSKFKTLRSFSGGDRGTGFGTIWLVSGLWRSTSAISSITLFDTSSLNLASVSTFALYGIKAP